MNVPSLTNVQSLVDAKRSFGYVEDFLRKLSDLVTAPFKSVNVTDGVVSLRSAQLQSFVFEISNAAGTLQHRFFGSHGDTTALGAYSGRIALASATAVNLPTVAAGVDFASGAGIDSTALRRIIFNTVEQINTNAFGSAHIVFNSTGTAGVVARRQNVSTDVNGLVRNRFGIGFSIDGTGAVFDITPANIPAGTLLRIQVVAAV